ncbi:hypothetical protein PAXINDRAFT_157321 [Paxillus involutus ATCC 200175]|uniref:Uncharacterized protein n=1 Tax=Paxillus involutus ATCC 200175 TaxID=664439 RepID=A0A0C9SSP0_PAXIN|nr:hypothetical protein PAXINDRAFT_157321 [Paxillus involutus ATCC 200175]
MTTRSQASLAGTLAAVQLRLNKIAEQKIQLTSATAIIVLLQMQLVSSDAKLVAVWEKINLYHSQLHNEHQNTAHAKATAAAVIAEVNRLQGDVIPAVQRAATADFQALVKKHKAGLLALQKAADRSAEEVHRARTELAESRKKIRALQIRLYHASKALGHVVACSRMKPKNSPARQLYLKGIYTATFHAIARRLVLAGCSQKSVGPAIQYILKALDMPVGKCCMSNWTVQRAVLEGGVAAKMQIGHEIVGTSSVNGDHSADQLKMFASVCTWKKEIWLHELGMQALRHCTAESAPLAAAVRDAYELLVDQAGGLSAWNTLSDRKILPCCCMHKELNSVKGWNAGMLDSWEENSFERPILLANKDNTATLQNVDKPSDAMTDAEVRALDVSGHGGVKVCTLAGAIFNHKDDKKGQQDTHHYYFEMIKAVLSPFSDTSNTRYQSYCEAAAELLTHLDHYITFFEQSTHKPKKSMSLTSVHYMTRPAFIVITLLKTQLFWQNPAAVTAVHQLFSDNKLPHPHEALVAFFRGAITTWEHFSAEFEGGGTIDHMSATNDANEGALGSYRLHACQKPLTSLHHHNALEQFKCNNTESFIDNTFMDADHSYTMKMAREWQAAGLEHKHQANLVKGDEGEVLLKRQQLAERAGKEAAEKARLDDVLLLVLNEEGLLSLKNVELIDQVNLRQ